MAVTFLDKAVLLSSEGLILLSSAGDILLCSNYDSLNNRENLDFDLIQFILNQPIIIPKIRLSVLNPDETLNYIIPSEDIIMNGINYSENYTNGQRKTLSIKLINTKKIKKKLKMTYDNQNESGQYFVEKEYVEYYQYAPNVNGLWYGTKIKYEIGFEYQEEDYYFSRGIYIINNLDLQYSNSQREVSYQLTDKFGLFDGNTGTLTSGYEIPVGTPIDEAIDGILNLSCTDGYINDPKPCIIDSKYSNFTTQSTIRVDEGGKIANIFEQLGTQMSAEYYYNNTGNLVFFPNNESTNDINKSIIWNYDDCQINSISLQASEDIVNVVKVVGTNVDGNIYTAIVKNDNLSSPLNIYRIKERPMPPINDANVWSDDMAKELATYHLRKHTIIPLTQQMEVPYNPILMVNNVVEIDNEDLQIKREKFLINNISYTSGSGVMSINVSNLDSLPIIGGLNT